MQFSIRMGVYLCENHKKEISTLLNLQLWKPISRIHLFKKEDTQNLRRRFNVGLNPYVITNPNRSLRYLIIIKPNNEPLSDLAQTSNVTPSPSSTLPSSIVTAESESSIKQSHKFDGIIRDGLHRSHWKTLSPIWLKHIFSQTRIN